MATIDLGKVALTPKGEYIAGNIYEKLDLVSYDGSGYASLIDNNVDLPTVGASWALVAEKGDTGESGSFADLTPEQIAILQQPAVDATQAANNAATLATQKANDADSAAQSATTAASSANTAATNANNAAANALTGIKGTATPASSPTSYTTGYLYEKYNVYEAGTYTNFKDASLAPIVVTSGDLAGNFVFIEVTNGVAKKVVIEIPANQYHFDPSQIVPSEALYQDNTLAGDIIKRIDKKNGINANYKKVTNYYDGSAMSDAKVDGKLYLKYNSEYYKITTGGNDINLESVGIIYNDVTKAVQNQLIILKLINANYRICIKDKLFLEPNTSDIDLLNAESIYIFGDNPKSEIQFSKSGIFLKPPSVLNFFVIKGIKFNAFEDTANTIIYKTGSKIVVQSLIIENNEFYKNIGFRVYGINGDASYFKSIQISNNKYYESKSYVYLFNDINFENILISKNQVYNMSFNFFFQGYNFENPLKDTGIVIVENNKVVNDDSCFCNTSGYHTFALLVGGNSIYRNNYVEGLKAKIANVAVYDVYQSTDNGEYYNNISKNNISFGTVSDGGTKALYKAKGGTNKICDNNTFTIEEEWIDKIVSENIGALKTNCWVGLISPNTVAENPSDITFTNNRVNVYKIKNATLKSQNGIKNLNISNNSINFDSLDSDSSGFFGIRQDNNFGLKRVYNFNNNDIIVRNKNQNYINIVTGITSLVSTDEIILNINRNNFIGCYPHFTYQLNINEINILGNTSNWENSTVSSATFSSFRETIAKKALILDNINIVNGNKNFYEYPFEIGFGKLEYEILSNYQIRQYSGDYGFVLPRKSENYKYLFKRETSTLEVDKIELDFLIKYTIESGVSYIQFKDYTTNIVHKIDITSPSFLFPNGTNTQIVLNVNDMLGATIGYLRLGVFNGNPIVNYVQNTVPKFTKNLKISHNVQD